MNKQNREFQFPTLWMDRDTWMYEISRATKGFLAGLKDFLKIAEDNRKNKEERHLICERFMGGKSVPKCNEDDTSHLDDDNHDGLEDMLHDVEIMLLKRIMRNPNNCLWTLRNPLFNFKANNGWSDKSFTGLLEFLHELLREGNEMSISLYQAKKLMKKLMSPMGKEIERIHACPNDCILYGNEYADLHECVTYGTSQYKQKNDAEKNDDVKRIALLPNYCGICLSSQD
ncbi:hypothetical protein LXL04_028912 [Taraxacum kok-saghyz]